MVLYCRGNLQLMHLSDSSVCVNHRNCNVASISVLGNLIFEFVCAFKLNCFAVSFGPLMVLDLAGLLAQGLRMFSCLLFVYCLASCVCSRSRGTQTVST